MALEDGQHSGKVETHVVRGQKARDHRPPPGPGGQSRPLLSLWLSGGTQAIEAHTDVCGGVPSVCSEA